MNLGEAWEGAVSQRGSSTAAFLFCDMVGSTDLLTRLGDDIGDEVRRDCYAALRRAVGVSRGIEVKSTGDGLMVVFPSSVADAVACGVAMQRGVARLDRSLPLVGVGLRVGIAVGEAVEEEGDWYGTPVVEAARLCAAARPGQILAADLVPALVGSRGGHRFTSLGSMTLKGLDVLAVSEVDWEPEAPASVLPLPSMLDAAASAPMVDRWAERESVLAAWRAAGTGSPRAVVVSGEAGIGRTRLVAEVGRVLHAEGATVLCGRCHEELAVPYEPFTEALGWYAGVCPPEDLRGRLGPAAGELVRLLPGLVTRVPDLPVATTVGEGARERLLDAVTYFLGSIAEVGPTVLVLEDLHLATPPTLSMLEHVLRSPTSGRLLVVATYRDSRDGPGGDRRLDELLLALRRNGPVDHLPLDGLDVQAVGELLAIAEGSSGPSDPARAAALRAESDGNPALVTRLVREAAAGGDGTLPCPFKGLAPFQPEDGELFFGRDDVVDGLLSRLANARLLGLVGPSGSGKSSVIRAGVLPALWRGALPASAAWRVAILTPGRHPVAELAAKVALLEHQSAAQLLRDLEGDPRALDLCVRQVLDGANPDARVLIVIDQLEELFTICETDVERQRFVDAVLHAASVPGGRTAVVTAIRADFYGHVADHPGLAAALEANHVLLGPLREDDLRAAIERPAAAVGMRLEPGLVDIVVHDVEGQPGALPLVSHAMAETWKHRQGRTLTVAGYRRAGGVRGALAATAEEIYADLDERERIAARRLLLHLVEVGDGTEDTARRATRAELLADGEPIAESVLHRLTDARLLLASDTTVEIAHEALIRAWPRLGAWLDDDRNQLQVISHLREAARAWERSGQDDSELYRGARLAAVLDATGAGDADVSGLERDFLDACRRREEAELRAAEQRVLASRRTNRRLRSLLAAAAVLLVVAVVAGAVAVDRQADARAAERLADARRVGASALVDQALDRALLLAVEGVRLSDTVETRGNLLATIERSPNMLAVARTDGPRLQGLALSPDGQRLVAGDNVGGVHVLDLATHDWVAVEEITGWAGEARYGPDGEEIGVLAETNGEIAGVLLLDAETLEPAGPTYRGYEGGDLIDLAIDPRGRFLAAAEADPDTSTEVVVWDRGHRDEPLVRFDVAGTGPGGMEFSPDGSTLAVTTAEGLALMDTATWTERLRVPGEGAVTFSADGARVAVVTEFVGGPGRRAAVFDVATGAQLVELVGHRSQITNVAFDATGDRVATASDDRTVAVWDSASGDQVEVFEGHSGRVLGLGFAPDGRTLYSSGLDATVIAWDLIGDRSFSRLVRPRSGSFAFADFALPVGESGASIYILPDQQLLARSADGVDAGPIDPGHEFMSWLDTSPDGRLVATVGVDGEVAMFDAATLEALGRARTIEGRENYGAIAFAPDSTTLVVAASDGEVLELDAATLEPTGRRAHADVVEALGIRRAGRDTAVVLGIDPQTDRTSLAPVDLATGEARPAIDTTLGPSTMAISPDGRLASLGGDDGRVAIADVSAGTLVGPPALAHDGPIGRMAFSPDSSEMVSGGFDGKLAFWDVRDGSLVARIQPAAANLFVRPTYQSDEVILLTYEDGSIYAFDRDVDAWIDRACRVAGRNLTEQEWQDAFDDRPYRATCPDV